MAKNTTPLELAIKFHEIYERLAPKYGYKTRPKTRSFDKTSPNGKLMIAVATEVLSTLPDAPEETKDKRRAKPPKRDAVWLDMDCPRCGYRFVAQDKWGRYCCCGPCDWTDAPEETT